MKAMSLYLIEIKALQLQFIQSFHKVVLHIVVNILQTMFKQTLEQSVGLYFRDVLGQKTKRVLRYIQMLYTITISYKLTLF
jgi:hypothetical protein